MKNKISSFFCSDKGSNTKTSDTLPEILRLGPNTKGSTNNPNQPYINYIKKVLSEDKIYNIGLIGDYASGKSTIIENFLDDNDKQKVIRLSLAKIELNPDKTNKENETNTIKEKILELLFWQAKVAVPNSILQSVYKPSKILQGFSAFLFSLVFAFIAFNKINLDIALLGNYTKISFYIVLLGCFSLIFWQLINFFIFLKNLGFSKINLKAQNFDLEISKNPFYKHLAQIIFILEEIAEKDYFVIVEDLDRFNEIEIFTALREISIIINYRLKNKKLPFLYALNSGLFAPTNQDKKPQKSVNDICKFFDVIIPVLKFSNNHTAKEEMLELITKEKTINSAEKDELEKVLEILCKNAVVDQRIAHNICNQYNFIESLKFKDKIDANKARAKLLAMTIFSIFDPQEYNALNNASGDVWQLLENILTDDDIAFCNTVFNTDFADLLKEIINRVIFIGGWDLGKEDFYDAFSRIEDELKIELRAFFKDAFSEAITKKLMQISIYDASEELIEKSNKFLSSDFELRLKKIAPKSQKACSEALIEIQEKLTKKLGEFFKDTLSKATAKKFANIKISDVSKELIKQKYIEKDYKDYLSRDPFQKDKVDSLAK